MSVSGGSGVSAGGSGGSVADLNLILAGGNEFVARLKLHQDRADAAASLLAEAKRAQAAADMAQAAADEMMARAEELISQNIAKGQELDTAIDAAKKARADLDGRLEPLKRFLRA